MFEGDFVDLIEKRINALTSPSRFSQLLHTQVNELVEQTDFSKLLAEGFEAIVNESDHSTLFRRQLKELTVHADFSTLFDEEGSILNAYVERLSESLCRAIRMESFRQIPYDQFIDRTFGSLPDFTLERDPPEHVDLGEEMK